MENEKYDGILANLLQEYKGYDGFFDNVFGFLRRKTDFFTHLDKTKNTVLESAQRATKQYEIDMQNKNKEDSKRKERELEKRMREEENLRKQQSQPKKEPEPKKEEVKKPESDEKNENSNKKAPNAGNGADCENYSWTQTLKELQISIPLKDNTLRGKNLEVEVELQSLIVKDLKNNFTYINDTLFEKVKYDDDEIIWTIDTDSNGQKTLHITIEKYGEQNFWWKKLVSSEEEINTEKVSPEPSKVNELDGEMQQQVRKMMFDMDQKKKGLPESDDLKKHEMLEKFKKQHPEMDFSKCKFN